jgi:type IV pilus assembly protein PilX
MFAKPNFNSHQTGSALFISLIILVLMTLIGSTATQTTVLEEKMAGNNREQNKAFQAAEGGLRDGELDIKDNIYSITDFTGNCTAASGSVGGLCLPSTTTSPQWRLVDWNNPNRTRTYGSVTKAEPLDPNYNNAQATRLMAKLPLYIIEEIPDPFRSPRQGRGYYGQSGSGLYRITAQGYGATVTDSNPPVPLARAMLQSVYRK